MLGAGTQAVMRDPVVAADGVSYERAAIEAWLQTSDLSPQTGQPLDHKELLPNHSLRSLLQSLAPKTPQEPLWV